MKTSKKGLLVIGSLTAMLLGACGGESSVSSVTSSSGSSLNSMTTSSVGSTISADSSEVTSSVDSSSSSSVSSEAVATVDADGADTFKSVDDADALSAAKQIVDTTSTDGYDAGRNVFRSFNTRYLPYSTARYATDGHPTMPSRGNSKMLVVPVLFSDTTKTADDKTAFRQEIYKNFFGTNDEVYWRSVRSYYYESSYHQLYISGAVSPCVTLPKTFDEYAVKTDATYINAFLETIYTLLFTGDNPIYKLSDFDSDNDGVIDSVYMVPDSVINHDKGAIGWAFTSVHINSRYASKRIPALGTYAWASVNFMTNQGGSVNYPDAHTFIHESGHILGLNDYYDTESKYNKAATSNMQCNNICDHESYSKYLWGWTSPKIVSDKNTEATKEIELKPFEDSGDTLIVGAGLNGTSLDEYLVIDYYTPTGLNKADSDHWYESESWRGIQGSGIRIWHVDKNINVAKLVKTDTKTTTTYFDPNPVDKVETVTDATTGEKTIPEDVTCQVASEDTTADFYVSYTTNSSSSSDTKSWDTLNAETSLFYIRPELELIRKDSFDKGYSENNAPTTASLFVEGDTFGATTDNWNGFKFYSLTENVGYDPTDATIAAAGHYALPYSIKVESVGDTAKLLLTKLS